jgi:hypothetical protein
MINRGLTNTEGVSGYTRSKRGASDTGGQAGIPRLKSADLSMDKIPAKIIGARNGKSKYRKNEDIVEVKLQFRNQFRLWLLTAKNPNLDILCDALGEDETQWADTDVLLFNHEDEWNGNIWPRVEVPSAPKKGGKK